MNERPPQRLGCLLVDEHPVVREGLRQILLSIEGLPVSGEASTRETATEFARQLQPAIAIVGMGGQSGRETGRDIRSASPKTFIVSFPSDSGDGDADADAVVSRSAPRSTILGVITEALGVADVEPLRRRERVERSISPREREVLELLAEGLSNRQISDRLVVSLETIKTHVRNILGKLGSDSRAHAVATGLRQGLIR